MAKAAPDKRYKVAKNLIETGYVSTFRDIFDILPKSIVAQDLGMNNIRFSTLMNKVDGFVMDDLFRIAKLLDISDEAIVGLVLNQYFQDKKKKK